MKKREEYVSHNLSNGKNSIQELNNYLLILCFGNQRKSGIYQIKINLYKNCFYISNIINNIKNIQTNDFRINNVFTPH